MISRVSLPDGWAWEHLVFIVVLTGAVSWWALAIVRIISFQRVMKHIDPGSERLAKPD